MTDSARFSWTVLLPVKVLARAKSRLAVLAGDRRGELALALASRHRHRRARLPRGGAGASWSPLTRWRARCSRRSARSSSPTSPRTVRRRNRPDRSPTPRRLACRRQARRSRRAGPAQRGAAARRRGGGAALAGNRARRAHRRPARAEPRRARPPRCAPRAPRQAARRSCRTPRASGPRCTRCRQAASSCRCSAGRPGHGTRRRVPPNSTSRHGGPAQGRGHPRRPARRPSRLARARFTRAVAGRTVRRRLGRSRRQPADA